MREVDIVINHVFIYNVPSNVPKESALKFKDINMKVKEEINDLLDNSTYLIKNRHCVRTEDSSQSFASLLKLGFKTSVQIEKLQMSLMTPRLRTILNPKVRSKEVFKFKGCLHSKVFLHLDWTVSHFTKILKEDLGKSLMARIDLMSDEAKNSECNIDPCLITEENMPRLTEFNLIYPQRVYCKGRPRDDLVLSKEMISYSDHSLIWEDDHMIARRVRSLLGIA